MVEFERRSRFVTARAAIGDLERDGRCPAHISGTQMPPINRFAMAQAGFRDGLVTVATAPRGVVGCCWKRSGLDGLLTTAGQSCQPSAIIRETPRGGKVPFSPMI